MFFSLNNMTITAIDQSCCYDVTALQQEWLWQKHHSPYYKTLYHQNDFEAVFFKVKQSNMRLFYV